MRRRGWLVAVAILAVAAGLAATALAGGSKHADPRKAAAALVRNLRQTNARCRGCGSFGATKVVTRKGALWLGVGTVHERGLERFRIYRWSGSSWRVVADVKWHGWGSTQWPKAVSLTGSRDPDFAIQGCGAGDTNCLSVVSDVGGRWRAVPFEYGYGKALVVNGVARAHDVSTEVDACGCAGGPSTSLYERYSNGVFRPASPPGAKPGCSRTALAVAAGEGTVPTLQFDRVVCANGWALAVGTGSGYSGRLVGLFSRGWQRTPTWRVLTLDDGLALAAAPTIYDLPLSLLTRLARRLGPSLTPTVAAAHLIAHLQHTYGFDWQQVAGIVRANGAYWLVAVVPTHPGSAAIVYRWTRDRWTVAGRVAGIHGFYGGWGGWVVSVPAREPGAVAFARAGSYDVGTPRRLSRTVITNAGGRWHVAVR